MNYKQLKNEYLEKLNNTKNVLTEIKETNIDILKKTRWINQKKLIILIIGFQKN